MNRMIDIDFKENEELFQQLQEDFNAIGEEALYMTHYELAEATGRSPIDWKHFIMDPRVKAFVNEEMAILEKTKAAVMLKTVDTNKNTGQAQLLNTLLNRTKGSDKKEGPVFIYTQIPLNSEEKFAENVVIYNEDNTAKDNTR